ncbi:MAG: type II secretion system protein [Epsilonproteobacteria bacterium]|nr:type II secretion system protein [Campylobacterota bacterium]
MKKQRGFSLIEIVITLLVIGVVISSTPLFFETFINSQKLTSTTSQIYQAQTTLSADATWCKKEVNNTLIAAKCKNLTLFYPNVKSNQSPFLSLKDIK